MLNCLQEVEKSRKICGDLIDTVVDVATGTVTKLLRCRDHIVDVPEVVAEEAHVAQDIIEVVEV